MSNSDEPKPISAHCTVCDRQFSNLIAAINHYADTEHEWREGPRPEPTRPAPAAGETRCLYRDQQDERRCPERTLAFRGFHLCALPPHHEGPHRCYCGEAVRDPSRPVCVGCGHAPHGSSECASRGCDCIASPAPTRQARSGAETENRKLRELLWLSHGCVGLYGDDGEMQCGSCLLDFKRASIDEIVAAFRRRAMAKLAAPKEPLPQETK